MLRTPYYLMHKPIYYTVHKQTHSQSLTSI